jgi:DNA repair protein RadD
VLDFAGVVETHGPITAVTPPNKNKGDGTGEAPVKVCDSCGELVHISAKECPACEALFPEPEKLKLELRDVDIMGTEPDDMNITEWRWRKHTSRASGKLMIAVDYYGGLSDPVITEYFPITHDGYAGTAAAQKLAAIANRCGAASAMSCSDLDDICRGMQMGDKPKKINYKKDGKYFRVTRRDFGGHLHVS